MLDEREAMLDEREAMFDEREAMCVPMHCLVTATFNNNNNNNEFIFLCDEVQKVKVQRKVPA